MFFRVLATGIFLGQCTATVPFIPTCPRMSPALCIAIFTVRVGFGEGWLCAHIARANHNICAEFRTDLPNAGCIPGMRNQRLLPWQSPAQRHILLSFSCILGAIQIRQGGGKRGLWPSFSCTSVPHRTRTAPLRSAPGCITWLVLACSEFRCPICRVCLHFVMQPPPTPCICRCRWVFNLPLCQALSLFAFGSFLLRLSMSVYIVQLSRSVVCDVLFRHYCCLFCAWFAAQG